MKKLLFDIVGYAVAVAVIIGLLFGFVYAVGVMFAVLGI